MTDGPRVPYWYLLTDEDGVSHQSRRELSAWEFKNVGNAAPQWNDQQERGEDWDGQPDATGRKGHRAGAIGDQPARLMLVRLHVPPVRRPCHLR